MKTFLLILLAIVLSFNILAQEKDNEPEFEIVYEVQTTPIKTQCKTGTCWAFATSSFWETELLRIGKQPYDISEMFTVRMTYPLKAEKFIRYHGDSNFGEGGQAHDVLHIFKKYGMVPEAVYDGNIDNPKTYNHGELTGVLKGALNAIVHRRGKITENWKDVCEAILNIYLGEPPDEFEYNGKSYTPKSFFEESGLNPDDYVELTSYTHHPFYEKFVLEVPDNWTNDFYYNLPIDELEAVIDSAIIGGYSVAWDGDVSKDNFYRKEGYAVIPVEENSKKDYPVEEKKITQQMRQKSFNDYDVTDDHLMHVTGLAKDQFGKKFYYTKNSWGVKDKGFDGFYYMSEQYVRLKTIAILVNKNAIPSGIRSKLKL